MRPREILQLKWEDIDFAHEVINVAENLRSDGTVGDRNTHKPVVLPLLDLARSAVSDVPRRLGSPFVFHNSPADS